MIKSSIKNIVVLPLFIATLLTSFYVMQPQQMVDAASIVYKDSGDDDGTPLASDRFNDIEQRRATAAHNQFATPGPVSDKIELELQQFIDCQTGIGPKNTCANTVMSGTQNVALTPGTSDVVDVEADLFMLQKDDTLGQDRVNNKNDGEQRVTANTIGSGSATVDISSDGDENELNMNMYQYNKRGAIESEDRSEFQIDDIEAAVDDEDGGGNDDSKNINTADQFYTATASDNSRISAATSSDQDFTVAQFNAGCDDTDPSNVNTATDITCENKAVQDISLQSFGLSNLNFETLSEIVMQQLNTCGFSQNLYCFNDGKLDVNVLTRGAGEANVELENPNGKPITFQENECSNLARAAGTTASLAQDCRNVSNNIFDVSKTGVGSNIFKTNLDLQVAQKNDCDDATAPIDCINGGLTSTIVLNSRPMSSFGEANTLVTVNAQDPGSEIEDADPDSFLTMVNDCDGAKRQSSTVLGASSCTNNALNEAHFSALSGANVDVDRVVQNSETTNNCDSLDSDQCFNEAQNTFVASAANDATININEDVYQTNDLLNNCNDAKCNHEALNSMLLTADDGATITASTNPLYQTNLAYNGCSAEAYCETNSQNMFNLLADPSGTSGGDINILGLTQKTDLSNTCSGSGTECILTANNLYFVTNTDNDPLTISPYQSITLSCSGSTDCTKDQTNTFTYTKTGGTSLEFYSTQTSTTGNFDNTYTNTNGMMSGCRQLTQTGTATTSTSTPTMC